MKRVSSDLRQARAQKATDKDVLAGVRTALALQKTTLQRRVLNYVTEHEKLVTNKACFDAELRKYGANIDKKLGRLQASLEDEKRGAKEEKKDLKRLFLSENSLNKQSRH